jgi:hypothetical protein
MRGEATVTLLQAYCISLPRDTALWTRIVFTRVLFRLRVSFCLGWMAKLSNVFASSFAWSFVNPLPKPLKFFVWPFENILYARQQFLNGILTSRPVECHLKVTNVQGDQAPAKRQKMLKTFKNSSTKTVAEKTMSSQTPLGSVMEFSMRS